MSYGFSNSWLFRTGQAWKVLVLVLGAVASLVAFGAAFASEGSGFRFLKMALGGVVLAAAVMAFFVASVRCPRCGKRPMGRLIRSATAERFGQELLFFRECPHCQYSGGK
jgi:hypothetical protein